MISVRTGEIGGNKEEDNKEGIEGWGHAPPCALTSVFGLGVLLYFDGGRRVGRSAELRVTDLAVCRSLFRLMVGSIHIDVYFKVGTQMKRVYMYDMSHCKFQ